ncbi:hypothetical protein ASPWEDRAFT_172752 [Aspergillus wentii DTO 134E9]|uniref:BTB domain-containing protein n=1 Tax=Aspergillus wentii DTO 134E9 TaxID=1073089 RepID=A0A1L9RMA5_ASPWE|nr:uncharacterized protein ASPWEDRAFT_172752 [Aspergillus wentii DTO 134E9]OJJ35967.1 hypothetical protein ASPWEDRAFT_172752 [Aspergillus wentii DTO 134E9]
MEPTTEIKATTDGMEKVLVGNIKKLFRSSKYTDVTIRTDDGEYKVHKLVLCAQSEYFNRLFDGNWRESNQNTIELKDDKPEAVKAMIHSMYGLDYATVCANDSPSFHASVCCVADKYLMDELKTQARAKYDLAVRKCLMEMGDDAVQLIATLYNEPSGFDCVLREPVTDICARHISFFFALDRFRAALHDIPAFAIDIISAAARNSSVR